MSVRKEGGSTVTYRLSRIHTSTYPHIHTHTHTHTHTVPRQQGCRSGTCTDWTCDGCRQACSGRRNCKGARSTVLRARRGRKGKIGPGRRTWGRTRPRMAGSPWHTLPAPPSDSDSRGDRASSSTFRRFLSSRALHTVAMAHYAKADMPEYTQGIVII